MQNYNNFSEYDTSQTHRIIVNSMWLFPDRKAYYHTDNVGWWHPSCRFSYKWTSRAENAQPAFFHLTRPHPHPSIYIIPSLSSRLTMVYIIALEGTRLLYHLHYSLLLPVLAQGGYRTRNIALIIWGRTGRMSPSKNAVSEQFIELRSHLKDPMHGSYIGWCCN